MAEQLCYENIQVGYQIPSLTKHPTTRQVVKWCCLFQRFYEIHYDKDFAISIGLPGVAVYGEMVASFLAQMLIDWIGEQGTIKKFNYSFRGAVLASEDVICKGRVYNKLIQDDDHCLECDVWAENSKGEKTVVGKAVIVLNR